MAKTILNMYLLKLSKKPLRWGKTGQKGNETKPFIFKPFITKNNFKNMFLKEKNLGYILVPKQILRLYLLVVKEMSTITQFAQFCPE